jgi:hypothetical protein
LRFRSEVDAKDFISARHLPRRSVYASDIIYRMIWTDQRMDDFAAHVDQRFDAVDKRLDRLENRFDGLQRTLILTGGGIIAALIGLIATQL